MAYRLTVTERAQREIGEAYDWYEEQRVGLGLDFLAFLEGQFQTLTATPQIYAEVRPGVRRALLARFPYGVFFASRGDLISILGVLHTARSPRRWPRRL